MLKHLLLLCLLTGPLIAQSYGPPFDGGKSFNPQTGAIRNKLPPNTLRADTIETIYLGYGRITTLSFNTNERIHQPRFGSPVAQIALNEETSQIYILPTVREGETNMNVRIGKKDYVFNLEIVKDDRVMFQKTFTTAEKIIGDLPSNAPPVKPHEIDTVKAEKIIRRMSKDPFFASQQRGVQQLAVDRSYAWNGCVITLADAWKFVAQDLLVLRIVFQNTTNQALYLHAKQVIPYVANKEFPVNAYTQAGPLIYPTQVEEIFLYSQGYRVSLDNAWEIKLPPQADAVRKLMGAR